MPDNQEQEIVEYKSQFNGEFMDQAFQKVLNPDSKPVENSTNLITSKALYDCLPKVANISLSSTWDGEGPYTQTVTIPNKTITARTKVDLQPISSQIEALKEDGVVSLYIENSNGVLTAVAFGGPPSVAMVIQCVLYEVII